MGLRIISGNLKGRRLCSLRGMEVRPTAARVRESVFNIISFCIPGKVVLDLFAGTGAFGIEALSRGAESAVFVEKQKGAISVIEKNIRLCALESRTKIIRWDIRKNLNCIRKYGPAFDLVFMDPPYHKNLIKPTLDNMRDSLCLKQGACIVAEHAFSEPIPKDCPGYSVTDQRKYGKTLVSFLDYML